MSIFRAVMLVVAAAVLVLFGLVMLESFGLDIPGVEGGLNGSGLDNKKDAKEQCQDFAGSKLAHPDTAEWDLSTAHAGVEWVITGTVTSKDKDGNTTIQDVLCELQLSQRTVAVEKVKVT